MDGFSLTTPGSVFLQSQSPSTIESPKEAPAKEPSEVDKLAHELRRMNETHTNYRSDSDRKIQELVQRNQVLQQSLNESLRQSKAPTENQKGSEVDQLWNGFLNGGQQQAPAQSSQPTDVKKVVLDTLQEATNKSAEYNNNLAQIETELFEKFKRECPDLHGKGNEVLNMWKTVGEINPSLQHNPVARYQLTVQKVREMFPSRAGTSIAGDSQPMQQGGSVQQKKKAPDNSFEAMAITEAENERRRFNELEAYVRDRKRQFGIRTGFPYDALEK